MIELRISGVREQDIDLLLWEEMVASPEFLSWFLAEAGIADSVDLIAIARSISTSNGESDLELDLQCGSKTIKVLIENKIDASLQPRQAERYAERCATYVTQGKCASALAVIIAPAAYFGDSAGCLGFERRVSYEAILEWFEQATALASRRDSKIAILREAVDHGGWVLVPDKVATDFWRLYWERASALAPDLRMADPKARPATSWFIYFRPLGFGEGVSLLHKLPQGNVDLQIARGATRVTEIQQRYGPYLTPDMRIDLATKSAVIRIRVPKIEMTDPLTTSQPAIDAGVQAAARLLALYRRVAV